MERRPSQDGRRFLGLLCLAAAAHGAEITMFEAEHLDLTIGYDPAAETAPLQLFLDSQDHERHFALSNAVVRVPENARVSLPGGTPFGAEGDSLWVLPQNQNASLPFLGVSAGKLPGIFSMQPSVMLISVEGPGDFFVWQATQFGTLEIRMNSRDGIDETDRVSPAAGGHDHLNWGFSTNGVYRITFQASGRRSGEADNIVSEPDVLTFHVLPLPAAAETPFQLWQREHFTQHLEEAGPGEDPDGDRLINLAEYAFGSDPKTASPFRYPAITTVVEQGERYVALEFPRVVAATDLQFMAESAESADEPQWERFFSGTVSNAGGTPQIIRIRDPKPVGESRTRFYRLLIGLARAP